MLFVTTTTSTTAYYEITGKFWNMIKSGDLVQRLAQHRTNLDVAKLRGRDSRLSGGPMAFPEAFG